VLITGSFNWTVQAVKSNNENVLMIQNEQLVKEYIREFDELWKEFKEEITPEEAKEETKKK
jgi:phosphatidylserine/phosphatidylglycerophosphate/cardiolipin synthase-like enzyme